jgi:BASS family bile acid:Na+ symporter
MKLASHLLPVVLNVGIAMAIFAYALRASASDIRFPIRDARLIGLSLLAIFVVTPAIAIAVIEWVPMPLTTRLVIVALSFSIIPPTLPLKQIAEWGNLPYANALTLTVAIVAIGAVPALADLAGRVTHHPYGVPAGELADYVAIVLAIPLVLGVLVRSRFKRFAARVSPHLTRLAFTVTTVALVVEVVAVLPRIGHLLDTGTVLGAALFTIGALGVGQLMGGPKLGNEMVLALSSANRHPAIALTIATANYPDRPVSAAMMLCLIVNGIICFGYSQWQRHRG